MARYPKQSYEQTALKSVKLVMRLYKIKGLYLFFSLKQTKSKKKMTLENHKKISTHTKKNYLFLCVFFYDFQVSFSF